MRRGKQETGMRHSCLNKPQGPPFEGEVAAREGRLPPQKQIKKSLFVKRLSRLRPCLCACLRPCVHPCVHPCLRLSPFASLHFICCRPRLCRRPRLSSSASSDFCTVFSFLPTSLLHPVHHTRPTPALHDVRPTLPTALPRSSCPLYPVHRRP